VEWLEVEAMSLNPSTAKEKKKKNIKCGKHMEKLESSHNTGQNVYR
jgi:hypothetical protein